VCGRVEKLSDERHCLVALVVPPDRAERERERERKRGRGREREIERKSARATFATSSSEAIRNLLAGKRKDTLGNRTDKLAQCGHQEHDLVHTHNCRYVPT